MPPPPTSPATPVRAWLLADGQPGNETQMRGLADALAAAGAEVEIKQVRANARHMLGAALLGASGASLDRGRSDPLTAPWPDLVIGTGRRSAAWTRYVKSASGGRTKAVQLGQKGANLMTGLDLAVVLGHWRFPEAPRRETIPLPPTAATADRLAAAASPRLLDPDGAPWLLLIVGGRCFDHDLTPADAGRLAAEAAAAASNIGGGLAIVTSRRTGAAAEAEIQKAAPDAAFFSWRDERKPFAGLLATADAAIVTGDSESMIAEAVAAGLPTYVSPVKPRLTLRMAIERAAFAMWRLGGPFAWAVEKLWAGGVLLPPRDLAAMADALAEAGYVRKFSADAVSLDWRPPPPPDAALAARLIRLARP